MIKSVGQVLIDIKTGLFSPVYLLHGNEGYFIDEVISLLKNSSLSSTFFYNFYSENYLINELLDSANSSSFLAERKVVCVDAFEELFTSGKAYESFKSYVNFVKNNTSIVFVHRDSLMDKRSKIYQFLAKISIVVESPTLSHIQIKKWISFFLSSYKLTIEPKAIDYIIENTNNDLYFLSNQLKKLVFLEREQINLEDIINNIDTNRQYNIFDLQKTVAKKNNVLSFKILDSLFAKDKYDTINSIVGMLFSFFSNLLIVHQYKHNDPSTISKAINVNEVYLDIYLDAVNLFSIEKNLQIINLIYELELQIKGINVGNITIDNFIYKQLYTILN